tara:strand:+ start:148 stop:756 length:609 start_codon:yes stop_codon:yes gene_type:complete
MESTMKMDMVYSIIPEELQREVTSYQYGKEYINYSKLYYTIKWSTLDEHCMNIIEHNDGSDLVCHVWDRILEIENIDIEEEDKPIDVDKLAFLNNLRPSELLYSDFVYAHNSRHKIWYKEDDDVDYDSYTNALFTYLCELDDKIHEELNYSITERVYINKLQSINDIYYYIVNKSEKITIEKKKRRMARKDCVENVDDDSDY